MCATDIMSISNCNNNSWQLINPALGLTRQSPAGLRIPRKRPARFTTSPHLHISIWLELIPIHGSVVGLLKRVYVQVNIAT